MGAVVLAAGKGTRMQSDLPKVLHSLLGRPMIRFVVETLKELGFGTVAPAPVFVVGYGSDEVKDAVGGNATYVIQEKLLGTGNAAEMGVRALPDSVSRMLLIHGDEPMIDAETYRDMIDLQLQTGAPIVLLTGMVSDAHALGRVIRGSNGSIQGLKQEKELDDDERRILEVNFGAYVFDRQFMEDSFPKLKVHDAGEYYLTDLVQLSVDAGQRVESMSVPYPDHQMGINDAQQLARAEAFLREKAAGSLPS